jgi:hypothetical protein
VAGRGPGCCAAVRPVLPSWLCVSRRSRLALASSVSRGGGRADGARPRERRARRTDCDRCLLRVGATSRRPTSSSSNRSTKRLAPKRPPRAAQARPRSLIRNGCSYFRVNRTIASCLPPNRSVTNPACICIEVKNQLASHAPSADAAADLSPEHLYKTQPGPVCRNLILLEAGLPSQHTEGSRPIPPNPASRSRPPSPRWPEARPLPLEAPPDPPPLAVGRDPAGRARRESWQP